MIDKQEFYHGVAILKLLRDSIPTSVRKSEIGYVVNDDSFIFVKYSTKSRSPWRFSFTANEVPKLQALYASYKKLVVAFVCGGDGVCAVPWEEVERLLGSSPGWISSTRRFKECYAVAGPSGRLRRKVALSEWPLALSDGGAKLEQQLAGQL